MARSNRWRPGLSTCGTSEIACGGWRVDIKGAAGLACAVYLLIGMAWVGLTMWWAAMHPISWRCPDCGETHTDTMDVNWPMVPVFLVFWPAITAVALWKAWRPRRRRGIGGE